MRPALVSPATLELNPDIGSIREELLWLDYEPPLGVLTVASLLRHARLDPLLFDLDGFLREQLLTSCRTQDSFTAAVTSVAALDADLFGFGTICGSYPLTLRLAEQVHLLRPDAKIVLGGPQASVVDVRTLEEFPFVDAIIRGEADQTVADAFSWIATGGDIDTPGVTYRKGNRIVRNLDSPVVLDLDRTPPPAFDLCSYRHRIKRMPVEMGRGCPFACTFCSTNDFFRRRFRLRSPACVLTEMRRLEAAYGTTDFDLVHDMFTVDRKRVVEFCRFLNANDSTYTWHCSARSDFVDRDLLQIMKDAGCRSLFFGIETGSPRLQKVIAKDLDIVQAAEVVELAKEAGITATVSLIVGFPEENREDLDATGTFALMSARFDSTRVQVGMLAPLSATPLYRKWRDELIFDGLFGEISAHSFGLNESDLRLIRRHPDLFSSFYGVPAGMGREYSSHFRWFLTYTLKRCRWLGVAFATHAKSITQLFDLWRSWMDRPLEFRYYVSSEFGEDLCGFVADVLAENSDPLDPVPLMASYYATIYAVLKPPEISTHAAQPNGPRLRSDVTLVSFPFRPNAVMEALRDRRTLDLHCIEPSTVALRRQGDKIVDIREVTDLGAAVLRLCNGVNTDSALIKHLRRICPDVPLATIETFLHDSLNSLRADCLIEMPAVELDFAGAATAEVVHQ